MCSGCPAQLEATWPLWLAGQENQQTSNQGAEGDTQNTKAMMKKTTGTLAEIKAVYAPVVTIFFTTVHLQENKKASFS